MSDTAKFGFRAALFVSTAIGFTLSIGSLSARAAGCEDLINLKIPATTIKVAESIAGGDYTAADKAKYTGLPAFCRVLASVKSAPDSDIEIEMWLPKDGWKGVFHGNGNGGYGGTLASGGIAAGVKRGYASATTDMGTAPATPLNGDPLIGHPRKWEDWGKLSTHVMTEVGKDIVKAFYGKVAKHSYYTGCSTGGQEGLIEGQYYPNDYDGILIGAPVVNRTWGHAAVAWDYIAANREAGHKLSDAKLTLLHNAAVSACSAKGNGLQSDPFISDPTQCNFDPAQLTCKAADSADCLTAAEVATAKAFYSGPTDHAGKVTYYGWPAGSETGLLTWSFLETPFAPNPPDEPPFGGLFKWVFGPDWNWRNFDFDRDMPKVDAKLGPVLNGAMTGDFSRFKARGGKLIIFQGWADPIVSPDQTVALYRKIDKKFGAKQDFARLFMAPGLAHCGLGGTGLNGFESAQSSMTPVPVADARHDLFLALSSWVEEKKTPTEVIATSYVDNKDPSKGIAMQRPLCPYPQKAWYKGNGDPNDAGSFVCASKGR
jgi:feruloyl esterase